MGDQAIRRESLPTREVVKVIRPGYRVGDGDGAVILRKVEVLIRGVEE